MASKVFPKTLKKYLATTGHLENLGQLMVALVSTSYTYSNAHEFYSDISANVLGTPISLDMMATVTIDGDNIIVDGAGDPVTFMSVAAGDTVGYVLFYDSSGNPATSSLITLSDVTNTPTTGGNIQVTINANGIFRIVT
jgi:hypothetical protein